MTLIHLLIFFAVFFVFAAVAVWVINKFLGEYKPVAFIIVGVILLAALLMQFFPQIGGYQVLR
jgi:hypothetical protein